MTILQLLLEYVNIEWNFEMYFDNNAVKLAINCF